MCGLDRSRLRLRLVPISIPTITSSGCVRLGLAPLAAASPSPASHVGSSNSIAHGGRPRNAATVPESVKCLSDVGVITKR